MDEQGQSNESEGGLDVKPIWCVVASVVQQREYGEEKEIRKGLKHFAAGAKVYCFPALWGDGYEKVKVVGRHRATHRFVSMIVPSKCLTNWRAKLVYSPYVVQRMADYWDGSETSKTQAKRIAHYQNTGAGEPFVFVYPGQPPARHSGGHLLAARFWEKLRRLLAGSP